VESPVQVKKDETPKLERSEKVPEDGADKPHVRTADKAQMKKTSKRSETSPEKEDGASKNEGPESSLDDHPDPLEGFELLSRKQIVQGLIGKHSDLMAKYKKEMGELDVKPPEIVHVKEDERSIRDNINDEVQSLKSKRKDLRDANKKLRSEFFDLLDALR